MFPMKGIVLPAIGATLADTFTRVGGVEVKVFYKTPSLVRIPDSSHMGGGGGVQARAVSL